MPLDLAFVLEWVLLFPIRVVKLESVLYSLHVGNMDDPAVSLGNGVFSLKAPF